MPGELDHNGGNLAAGQDATIRPTLLTITSSATRRRCGGLTILFTRSFPPDFAETMKGHAPAFIVEMSTAPDCLPCADLWTQLGGLGQRYGWRIRAIPVQEAMLRSGRLGLPWIGHPVAWVRPVNDTNRIIPIAVGTDHAPNLARNLYLAAKMLTGVRPAVGVRALSKFTGIVAERPGIPPQRRAKP